MLVSGLFKNAILMSGSPLAHWAMAMPNQYPGSNINSTILRIALNAADIRQISVQDLIAIESIMSKVIANFTFFLPIFGKQLRRGFFFKKSNLSCICLYCQLIQADPWSVKEIVTLQYWENSRLGYPIIIYLNFFSTVFRKFFN